MSKKSLSESQRKAIFLALVNAQDGGAAVAESLTLIAQQFDLDEQQVRQIENEGLDNNWPPL
jgi:DNA-directed RNA polymerase sigma subunit (sigma70/sigma32)